MWRNKDTFGASIDEKKTFNEDCWEVEDKMVENQHSALILGKKGSHLTFQKTAFYS